MTEQDATKIVILLVATFPTPSWEKQTMQVYREMLVDPDAAATTQVVRDWIKTHDERPTIAAIRCEVGKLQAAASGASFLPADDEAWSYVMRCRFGSVGQYREFPAEHPLVKKAGRNRLAGNVPQRQHRSAARAVPHGVHGAA